MGAAEPLIHISSRTYRIARNGEPLEVDLSSGEVSKKGNIRVQVILKWIRAYRPSLSVTK